MHGGRAGRAAGDAGIAAVGGAHRSRPEDGSLRPAGTYPDFSRSSGARNRQPSRRMACTPSHSSRAASSRMEYPEAGAQGIFAQAGAQQHPSSTPGRPPSRRPGGFAIGQTVFTVEVKAQQPNGEDYQQVDALRGHLRPAGPYQHQQQDTAPPRPIAPSVPLRTEAMAIQNQLIAGGSSPQHQPAKNEFKPAGGDFRHQAAAKVGSTGCPAARAGHPSR